MHLEPQPARALARLLAGAGEPVTRDELRDAIWGTDTHVDYDRGLAYGLGQIRVALGDRGENPRFVHTLPNRGFRFVAPVSASPSAAPGPVPAPVAGPVAGPGSERRGRRWLLATAAGGLVLAGGWWRQQQTGAARAATVAVSIFDNETGDPAHDTFVQGLSDVVVTRLTALARHAWVPSATRLPSASPATSGI